MYEIEKEVVVGNWHLTKYNHENGKIRAFHEYGNDWFYVDEKDVTDIATAFAQMNGG